MPILKRSIHAPGLGRNFNHLGFQLSSKYGEARPSAMTMKNSTIMCAGCAKAKPSDAPKNGAVQGVASTVASTPFMNAPALPWREDAAPAALMVPPPRVISKMPNKLSATSVTMTVRATMK